MISKLADIVKSSGFVKKAIIGTGLYFAAAGTGFASDKGLPSAISNLQNSVGIYSKLKFSRNYKNIRPYTHFCEEFIELIH